MAGRATFVMLPGAPNRSLAMDIPKATGDHDPLENYAGIWK
jgi:hypothetical protein